MSTRVESGSPISVSSGGEDCCCGDGCGCECCTTGVWSEFTLITGDIAAILGGCDECDLFEGTYVLTYRGIVSFPGSNKCVWASEETYDGDCVGASGCITVVSDPCPKWTLTVEPDDTCGCIWTLTGAFGAVQWNAYTECETVGADTVAAQPDFCVDGGDLVRFVADIGENTCTGPTTMTVTPTGVFMPC